MSRYLNILNPTNSDFLLTIFKKTNKQNQNQNQEEKKETCSKQSKAYIIISAQVDRYTRFLNTHRVSFPIFESQSSEIQVWLNKCMKIRPWVQVQTCFPNCLFKEEYTGMWH